MSPIPGGYYLICRYVRPQRVRFLSCFGLKRVKSSSGLLTGLAKKMIYKQFIRVVTMDPSPKTMKLRANKIQ